MLVFEMFLGVIIVLSITAVVIVRTVFKNEKQNRMGGDSGRRLREVEARLGDIEARLKNVETITTSKTFNLEREFEELKRS